MSAINMPTVAVDAQIPLPADPWTLRSDAFEIEHAADTPLQAYRVDVRAQFAKKSMRLGQILAVGVFPFVKIRHGIEPKSIHAHGEPEIADLLHGLVHRWIVKIQVGLM